MHGYLHSKPRRLAQVFAAYRSPLYFVTFCTYRRQRLLDCADVHDVFLEAAAVAREHGAAEGRYVLMPDHIHMFFRLGPNACLGLSVKCLKRAITKHLHVEKSHLTVWQEGFFDHLLRSDESYAQKWSYVSQNPVRAGLVRQSCDWPFQGEVCRIDRL